LNSAIVVTFSEVVSSRLRELFSQLQGVDIQHVDGKKYEPGLASALVMVEIPDDLAVLAPILSKQPTKSTYLVGITQSHAIPTDIPNGIDELIPLEELSHFWINRLIKERSQTSSPSKEQTARVTQDIFNRFPIEIIAYTPTLTYEFLNEYALPNSELREWAIGKTPLELLKKLGNDTSTLELRTQKLKECINHRKHLTWYENFKKEKGLSYQLYGAFPLLNEQGDVASVVSYGNDITNEIVAEKSLKFRIGFENLLIEYSNKFINISSEDLDEVVGDCIREIGEYVDTDRVYIFQYDEDEKTMSNTHEWCGEDITAFKEELQGLSISKFAYWTEGLKRHSCISVDDVEELPKEARVEKLEFLKESISSIICAPLRVNNKITGFIGFDSVRKKRIWSQELKDFITLSAQVISNALERKKSESALVNSEEKFRTLTEKAHAAIFITQDYRFVYANPETGKLTGYSEDELLTQNLIELLDLEEKNSAIKSGEKIRQDESYNARNERKIITKSGEVKHIDITSNKIKYNDQDAMISIAFDVTEKHKKDEEEKKLIQQLIQQNLDLEQFSYITSHNLRSPVAGIKGLISILEKESLGSELNHNVVERIEIAANKLDVVIKDLNEVITMRNTATHNRQKIVLSELLDEIIDTHREMIENSGAVILRDFYQAPTITTVKGYLTSILTNLITNAIKYRKPEEKPIINISSSLTATKIELTVKDNGLGIDLKKYGKRLFKFKQRFHTNVEGHGMGLYLVRTQAHSLGGKARVESEVGKGSSFIITLNK